MFRVGTVRRTHEPCCSCGRGRAVRADSYCLGATYRSTSKSSSGADFHHHRYGPCQGTLRAFLRSIYTRLRHTQRKPFAVARDGARETFQESLNGSSCSTPYAQGSQRHGSWCISRDLVRCAQSYGARVRLGFRRARAHGAGRYSSGRALGAFLCSRGSTRAFWRGVRLLLREIPRRGLAPWAYPDFLLCRNPCVLASQTVQSRQLDSHYLEVYLKVAGAR